MFHKPVTVALRGSVTERTGSKPDFSQSRIKVPSTLRSTPCECAQIKGNTQSPIENLRVSAARTPTASTLFAPESTEQLVLAGLPETCGALNLSDRFGLPEFQANAARDLNALIGICQPLEKGSKQASEKAMTSGPNPSLLSWKQKRSTIQILDNIGLLRLR